MKQLKKRIIRLLKEGSIKDIKEREKFRISDMNKEMESLLHKHPITSILSIFQNMYLKNHRYRWYTDFRQRSRYIKRRMGNEPKNKIPRNHNGNYIYDQQTKKY